MQAVAVTTVTVTMPADEARAVLAELTDWARPDQHAAQLAAALEAVL